MNVNGLKKVGSRDIRTGLAALFLLGGLGLGAWESNAAPAAPSPAQSTAVKASAPTAAPVRVAAADLSLPGAPKEVVEFMDRLFKHVPPVAQVKGWKFLHWGANKPTEEAVGLKPVPGIKPDKLIERVMDVNHYIGNIDRVHEIRSIKDDRFKPPAQVRFFQVVDISPVGKVQQELVLVDAGTIRGYRVAYWYLLKEPTLKLNRDKAARSDYNVGAWLAAPGIVGYSLSSAPLRDDVNWVQWKALTTGADVAAETVIEKNIDGMAKWANK